MCSRKYKTAIVLFIAISVSHCTLRKDNRYWEELAKNELEEALRVKWNTNVAKNVILFIGDGMGPNTVTATRIYAGGESHRLVYEKFPHVGLLKTYSANTMVPDSACTATALFYGIKTNKDTVGVDASVPYKNCTASLQQLNTKSLMAYAMEAGKTTGLVTTMRVTHATPAPLYAHSADRNWECEASMPENASQCKDIARQLIEDWPGRNINVILGGGRQMLVSNSTGTEADPIDTWSCYSRDGRNLIETYKADKEKANLKYSYVTNNRELKGVDVDNTDYLLGIFANGHLRYEFERNQTLDGTPSISEMVEAAIKILRKNKNGFFLMVEGGNIDMAHHRGRAKTAIDESAAMEKAVKRALEMTDEEETLLIVTSDHTHTLSINGYPERGSNIFGIAQASKHDSINYTTLSYSTGGPGAAQYYISNATVVRRDPSTENTDDFHYEQIASIISDENTHGGGDVAIYANGPYAHLFHNTHEQHYVFHVISHAAKLGAYSSSQPGITANGSILIARIAQASKHDSINYTTLSYSTGGPGAAQYYISNATVVRRDPSTENTDDFHYEQIASIISDENTHGGGDVAIYANGPYAHLFHNTHEQHYVFHVISHAAKLGAYSSSQPGITANGSILIARIAQASKHDSINYTTLSYSTGGPGAAQYYISNATVVRRDPSTENTDDFHYEQIASIISDENTHGGGDVAIYANGPYAHLFHNTHEQHYVFHVISHAAKLGAYSSSQPGITANGSILIASLLLIYRSILQLKIQT